MRMNRHTILVLASALLLLASGLVAGLALRAWPGAGGSSNEFPAFVYQSPDAERGYQLARENQQLFAHLACYCGCGVFLNEPHQSLLDCFMNGGGTLDAHASGCSLCLDIAFDGVEWQAQGKSLAEVRALADEKYASYGPPTRQEAIQPVG